MIWAPGSHWKEAGGASRGRQARGGDTGDTGTARGRHGPQGWALIELRVREALRRQEAHCRTSIMLSIESLYSLHIIESKIGPISCFID